MAEARQKKMVIAVDGPAGAGKSTVTARLARELGYTNIETGAMYRALALKAIESDVSVDDEQALLRLAQNSRIELEPTLEGNRVLLNGRDVSQRIRERDVTEAASRVAIHPPVRQWMVARQREMGAAGGVVMEGRDIGTKVFPDADIKIFLDADPTVRGERRFRQQHKDSGGQTAGTNASAVQSQAIIAQLRERDQRDRTRPNSPLVPAPDAVVIDATNLSIDEVLDRIREVVASRATH